MRFAPYLVLLVLPATAAADARFTPSGSAAIRTLLGGDKVEAVTIRREVQAQGFYSGGASGAENAIGAGPCAGCHADVAAQWSGSAHRFASFNNPYYVVSVDEFRRERGAKASRFCASCHDPLLIATGAIDRPLEGAARATPTAQAGIVCLVCHSIDSVDGSGNGGYHVKAETVPLGQPAHGQRLRRALLGESRLCAACHKVGLTPEVTHDRWLRGQDDYDPWLASAASGHGANSIFRPAQPSRCQDCHMPYEPAVRGDAAARPGPDGTLRVRSHRFLGANTALPTLRGDDDMVRRESEFLAGKVTMALHPLPPGNQGEQEPQVSSNAARAGELPLVDVVLRSRGIGHRFPSGTMDSNEVWLEVDAFDAAGQVIGRSGGRDASGALLPDTHLVRVQAVDGDGHPLLRRDPQHMRGVVYDNALGPSDPVAVRFAVPAQAERVRARLLYRKFSVAYAGLACAGITDVATRQRCNEIPTVEVVQAETTLAIPQCPSAPGAPGNAGGPVDKDLWQRYLEHGVALAAALVERVPEALPDLQCAQKLAPQRPEPYLGLSRLALALGQVDDAVAYSREASARAPEHPAALFLRARAFYQAYRFTAAREPVEQLAERLPADPSVLALLARIRGVTEDAAGALAAAEHLILLDPDSAEGHYQRSLALRELGRSAEADEAEARYLYYRHANETDLALRQRFRQLYPDRANEDVPVHTHVLRPLGG
jgi:Flp pilus assembly protein TadD